MKTIKEWLHRFAEYIRFVIGTNPIKFEDDIPENGIIPVNTPITIKK